jgi:hypothetical protein
LDLDNLTADKLRQALALYLREAWPQGLPPEKRAMAILPAEGSLPEVLRASAFEPICIVEGGTRPDIWMLRVGSAVSPRVKLTLKRVSLSEDVLFNVDTHDLYLSRSPGEETEEERRECEEAEALKRRVEEAWGAAGLPTFVTYMQDYLDRAR